MNTFKNLLLITLVSGIVLTSCEPENQDTTPVDPFASIDLNLDFTPFDTIIGQFVGQDIGFNGSASTNKLYLVHRDREDDNYQPVVIDHFNISTKERSEFRHDPPGAAGFSRELQILNDKIYVISNAEMSTYDMNLNVDPIIEPHHQAFTRFGSFVYNGEIYVIGGDLDNNDPDNILSNKLRKWNAANGRFEVVATMPGQKVWAGGAVVDDKLYIFGGQQKLWNTPPQSSIFIYDFNSGTFETTEMAEPIDWTFVRAYKGKIIVAGKIVQETNDPQAIFDRDIFFEVFDPSSRRFGKIDMNLSDDGLFGIHDLTIVGNQVFVIYGDPLENNPNKWTIQQATINF